MTLIRLMAAFHEHVKMMKYNLDTAIREMAGAAYYCKVLEGEIPFSPIINSNMTVSCCEHDYDQSCVLGNLRESTLQDIVNGPVVDDFRRKLAKGDLPSRMCAFCHYRRPILTSNWGRQGRFQLRSFRIEPSRFCNLRCLGCCNQKGSPEIRKAVLSVKDIEILCKNINANNTSALILCGRGEPFDNNFYDLMVMIRRNTNNVLISSSTNGILLDNEKKIEGVLMLDHLSFSMFGPNNRVYGIYHRGGNFDAAYANMTKLVQIRNQRHLRRPIIEWKYVMFWWNDRKVYIVEAIRLASAVGVDCLGLYPSKNPFWGISLRYKLDPFYKHIGFAGTNGGRKVVFSERTDAHDILLELTPSMP